MKQVLVSLDWSSSAVDQRRTEMMFSSLLLLLDVTNSLIGILLIAVLLGLPKWIRHRKTVRLVDRIPGPPGLPLIGNVFDLNIKWSGIF